MLLHQQNLKPEVQAVLDICEMQEIPVEFKHGVFRVEAADLGLASQRRQRFLGTQNVNTVLRWVEIYKKRNNL